MPKTDRTYEYIDPRRLDGTPYQVAAAAFEQAAAVGELYATALDDSFVFARIAQMERECENDGTPDGAAFPASPLGARIVVLQRAFVELQRALTVVSKAATYDPKNPPQED